MRKAGWTALKELGEAEIEAQAADEDVDELD